MRDSKATLKLTRELEAGVGLVLRKEAILFRRAAIALDEQGAGVSVFRGIAVAVANGGTHVNVRYYGALSTRGGGKPAKDDYQLALLHECGDETARVLGEQRLPSGLARLAKHASSCLEERRSMQVNILEAKNQLSKLVKAAAAGREVVIAKNGKPMARLVPIIPPRRLGSWGSLKVSQARIDQAFSAEVDEGIARTLRGRR